MSASAIARQLAEANYNRERLDPRRGDPLYLHLGDLRIAMETATHSDAQRVLDYGCGGSPYRPLFGKAEYKRADFLDCGDLDYVLGEDSLVPEEGQSFDLILSTQVLEHVPEPAAYLAECHRLLTPNGELLLTTHGVFEDHGCPYDFQRWTADGLRRLLQSQGFEVVRLVKLTTGPRAVTFLTERIHRKCSASRRTVFGWVLWCVRALVRRHRNYLHTQCDIAYAANRVVDASAPGHGIYVGLLASCRKVEH